jgi:hypothetical protein
MRISELFRHPPSHWGLRGDPFLWGEMARKIGTLPLPGTKKEFEQLLAGTFENWLATRSHRTPCLASSGTRTAACPAA